MKRIVLIAVLLIFIIASICIGLILGTSKTQTESIWANVRKFDAVEDEDWNLSLLLYDSSINNGRTSIQEDIWNATEGEVRILTTQVNISNANITRDYQPGELVIAVDSLGKAVPTDNEMTSYKTVNTISADDSNASEKKYDWTYRYDSSTQKYIFTNNYLIE